MEAIEPKGLQLVVCCKVINALVREWAPTSKKRFERTIQDGIRCRDHRRGVEKLGPFWAYGTLFAFCSRAVSSSFG